MTADEIATVERQFRQRVQAILTPGELASYDAYQQRVQQAIDRRDLRPVAATPAEQAVLDIIAGDTQAAALHKQLLVLLRIETLPQ
jgi:hypothetical protein